ncbi:MAG: RNA 2',3'-cyclic phosphodiesterase, partial [Chloroflexota bacterium]
MEEIRSFIAIELPDEVKSILSQLQAKLKSCGEFPAKWIDPSGIHLTLKFLGNITSHRITEITRALETAASGTAPLQLELKGLGVFPSLKRVQVIWVGIEGELDKLGELQKRIESGLAKLGFPREARAFTPHLTLARIRDRATPEERQCVGQVIASTKFETVYRFNVDSIHLMRSELTREGAIYSR